MGGVDKMDFLISLYPMDFRSKRWPTRVILHMLSMSLVNAWIEYRERESAQGTKKNIMDLLSFREHVAETLCKAETNTPRPVGRPSYASMLNYCPIPNKKLNQQQFYQTRNADITVSIIGHNQCI